MGLFNSGIGEKTAKIDQVTYSRCISTISTRINRNFIRVTDKYVDLDH